VKRTSISLTDKQFAGSAEAVKTDSAGRKQAHLIRQFVGEGLTRLKRQQK